MTEYSNAIEVVVQRLGYDAVIRLQDLFERAYSTIRVLCLVASTFASGAVETSVHWKNEGSEDDEKSEPAEGCFTETRQDYAKDTCIRGSWKGRRLCC